MGKFTVKLEGVEDLIKKVKKLPQESQKKVAKVVVDYALKIQNSAKKRAPVRTGNLRRSITAVFDYDYLGAWITAYAPYADFVEFGTRKMKAQPYLYPAYFEYEKEYLNTLRKTILEVLSDDS